MKSSNVIVHPHDTELVNNNFFDMTETKCGQQILVKTYYDYKDLHEEKLTNHEYRFNYQNIEETRLDLYIFADQMAKEAAYIVIQFRDAIVRLPRKLLKRLIHFVVEMEEEVIDHKQTYTIKLINPRYRETTASIPLQEDPIEFIIGHRSNDGTFDMETCYMTQQKSKLSQISPGSHSMRRENNCVICLPCFDESGIFVQKSKKLSEISKSERDQSNERQLLQINHQRVYQGPKQFIPLSKQGRLRSILVLCASLMSLLFVIFRSK